MCPQGGTANASLRSIYSWQIIHLERMSMVTLMVASMLEAMVMMYACTVASAAVHTPFIFPPLFLQDPPSVSLLSQPSRKTA